MIIGNLITGKDKTILKLSQMIDKEREVQHILTNKIKEKDKEIERLNNIIDNARKYIENNQSGGNDKEGHFHINFDGDIWELYEMLRIF